MSSRSRRASKTKKYDPSEVFSDRELRRALAASMAASKPAAPTSTSGGTDKKKVVEAERTIPLTQSEKASTLKVGNKRARPQSVTESTSTVDRRNKKRAVVQKDPTPSANSGSSKKATKSTQEAKPEQKRRKDRFPGKRSNAKAKGRVRGDTVGVDFDSSDGRYKARYVDATGVYELGQFDTELAAACAYDYAALIMTDESVKSPKTNFDWYFPAREVRWRESGDLRRMAKDDFIRTLVNKSLKKDRKGRREPRVAGANEAQERLTTKRLATAVDVDAPAANHTEVAADMAERPEEVEESTGSAEPRESVPWWFENHVQSMDTGVIKASEDFFCRLEPA